MFSVEKIAANILTHYLGTYVEGLKEKNLQISLMKGSVNLSNLQLKKEALDGLELPITVKSGYLGELELIIPWQNLKFEQATLRIKKIYLEAGPKEEKDEVLSATEKVIATKKRILRLAELVADDYSNEENNNSNSKPSSGGYIESITANVINNLQIFIDDVHIRYIDKGMGCEFGIRFNSLHAQSTDFFWQPKVITQNDVKDKLYYKLVQLTQFSLYWNTSTFNNQSKEEFQNILSPVDVNVQLIINKNDISESALPKMSINCIIPFIQIDFRENQYKELLQIIEFFSNYRKSMNYLHLRPTIGPPKGNPIHWWKYVLQSVSLDIKKRNQRGSWAYILRFLKDKRRYIFLYAKKKLFEAEKIGTLSDDEQKEIETIEYQYEVDQVINFRNLSNLLSQNLQEDRKKKKEELSKKKNWLGKMWNQALPFEITSISATELQELEFQLIINKKTQNITPKEYIQNKIEFTLQDSEINIIDENNNKIMALNSSHLSINCFTRSGGLKLMYSVQYFCINDFFTPQTVFPKILFAKDFDRYSEPIFQSTIDFNPPDKDIYLDMDFALRSINFVFPRKLLYRAIQFFAVPLFERKSRSLEQLAIEKLQKFKNQATKNIQDIFENNKKIALNVQVSSPKILIPVNIELMSSPVLIIDLGMIKFNNNDQVIADNYSPYLLSLSDTNANFTSIESFLLNSNLEIGSKTLVEHFHLESKIEVCRFQAADFPLLKVAANIDHFHATISESSTTNMLLILDDLFVSSPVLDRSITKIEEDFKFLSEIPKIEKRQLEVKFTVGEVQLQMIDDKSSSEILKLCLKNLQSVINKSNQFTVAESTLSSAYIFDSNSIEDRTYMFTSEIENSGASLSMVKTLTDLKGNEECLISLNYKGFPENSPQFTDFRHQLVAVFNSVHFFVNAITLKKISQFSASILAEYIRNKTPKKEKEVQPNDKSIQNLPPKSEKKLLVLQLVINSVGFTIPLEGNPIEGFLAQSEISLGVFPTGDYNSVGQIGKVTIDYHEATRGGFSHLLEIESDKLFKFEIHRNAPKPVNDQKLISLDYLVELDIGSLKLNYFHSFFALLRNYFKSIKTNYSLQNSPQSTQSHSKLIGYEIKIENPQIIIPVVCEEFTEGLLCNLGAINIKNKLFSDFTGEGPVLKENINVGIQNFSIESFSFPAYTDSFIRYIVENTSVNIEINKNHHNEIDKDIVWNIKSSVPSFTANITRYHVSVLRSILKKNFLFNNPIPSTASQLQIEENKSPDSNCESNSYIVDENIKIQKRIITFSSKVVKSSIRFYNGDGVDASRVFSESQHGKSDENLRSKSPSLIQINTSRTLFSCIFQKNLTTFEIATAHFTLDDVRSTDQPIYFSKMCTPILSNQQNQNIIQSSLDDVYNNQFTLKFISGKDLPTTFEISIENHFIVVMDAWTDMAAYFLLLNPEIKLILSHVTTFLNPENISSPTPMKIIVNLPSPDLCLIKDEYSSSSEAIIIRSSINFEWISEPTIKSQIVKIHLKDAEIFRSRMNTMAKMKTMIEKTNINLSYQEITKKFVIYSISVLSAIDIQMTFRDYLNIRKLIADWMPSLNYIKFIHTSIQALWNPVNLSENIVEEDTTIQRFDITSMGGNLLILNDLDVFERPLLTFFMNSFRLSIYNWSRALEISLDSTFRVDYMNEKLGVWEPMLEQTKIEFSLSPNNNTDKNITTSIDNINVNISCSFIDALLNTFKVLKGYNEDKKQDLPPIEQLSFSSIQKLSKKEEKNYQYFIRNELPIQIMYGLSDNSITPPTSVSYIGPNKELPLIRDISESKHNFMHLCEDNDSEIYVDHIPIDRIGKYKSRLAAQHHFYCATCEVSNRDASKVLVIRSNRVFINSSQSTIVICIKTQGKDDKLYTIEPNQTIPINVYSQSQFCLTTNSETHNFTKFIPFIENKELYYITTVPKSNRSTPMCYIMKYNKKDCDHIFEIFSSFILQNELPIPLTVSLFDSMIVDNAKRPIKISKSVAANSSLSMHEVSLNVDRDINLFFEIAEFGRSAQPLPISISFSPRFSQNNIQFNSEGSPLILRAYYSTVNHIRKLVIYCDYWIINNSSLNLFYQVAGKNEFLPGQVKNNRLVPSNFLLYSPSMKVPFFQSSKLTLKVQQSVWSEPFAIERDGINTSLSVENSSVQPQMQYELIVSVKNEKDSYWRTKQVYIHPKYVIINQTAETLHFCQSPLCSDPMYFMQLDSNNYVNFHWPAAYAEKELSIRFSEEQEWSNPFSLHLNHFSMKVRNRDNNSTYSTYSISIYLDSKGISTIIAISYLSEPEYLILNQSNFNFSFRQKRSPFNEVILSNNSLPFALDFIQSEHILTLVREEESRKLEIPLDQYSFADKEFKFGENSIYWTYYLGNEGKTKVLLLKNSSSEVKMDKIQAIVSLSINNVAISLIDEKPQEIALLYFENLTVKADLNKEELNIDISLETFQFDNQLLTSPFPVLIRPINPLDQNEPNVHIITSFRRDIKSVYFFNVFQLFVKPIDCHLDEEIIVRFIEYSKEITNFLEKRKKQELSVCENEFFSIANRPQSAPKSTQLYFNHFKISPIELAVSFRVDAASADEEFNRLLPSYFRLLLNFEGTTLTFDELYTVRISCLPSELLKKLSSYYSISMKNKLYFLLSSDLIGNPKSLVSNIGVGVYDFFNEPTYAIVNSPANIGAGFARGTKSLVLNSLYALSNTTSKLSDSLASGVATVSFDSNYQRERDWNNARDKPQDLLGGAAAGFMSLGKGILGGLTGVITEPIKGSQEGTTGVLKGLVKGTTGLIVKPTVGVLDSVSKFSESVKNTTLMENVPNRIRLPRFIGRDKVVKEYDEEQAKNQFSLHLIDRRFAAYSLQAFYRVNNGSEKLMLTERHIIFVRHLEIIFELSILQVTKVVVEELVIAIQYFTQRNSPTKVVKFKLFLPNVDDSLTKQIIYDAIGEELKTLISILQFNAVE